MKYIYALYDCDEYKSDESMSALRPICVTTSKKRFLSTLKKEVDDDEKELKSLIKNSSLVRFSRCAELPPALLAKELNDILTYYYVMVFEDK